MTPKGPPMNYDPRQEFQTFWIERPPLRPSPLSEGRPERDMTTEVERIYLSNGVTTQCSMKFDQTSRRPCVRDMIHRIIVVRKPAFWSDGTISAESQEA